MAWYNAAKDRASSAETNASKRLLLDQLERDLRPIIQRWPQLAGRIGAIHETISQAGMLEFVGGLHLPTPVTLACGLPKSTLTRAAHRDLYRALGAQTRPSSAALLTALRTDPDPARLIVRLEAYKAIPENLQQLAAEKIIQVNGQLLAAEDCAFEGEPDYWGAWKVRIAGNDVAEHHSLLVQLGVTRIRPTRDLSIGFFRWLGNQKWDVQQQHHAVVERHWKDPSAGPLNWIASNSDVRCIPVTGAGHSFELVNLDSALRQSQRIFLDDFPELRDSVLADGRTRLTLVRAPGSRSTILDMLTRAGVPSLRNAAGAPKEIRGVGELEVVADLSLELSQMQSRRRLAELRTKLPLYGVDSLDLRADWQKLLRTLKGVRSKRSLTAVYRTDGRDHEVAVRSGLDRASGMILVTRDSDKLHEMYEILAEYIFRRGRVDTWGLLRAARDRRQLDFLSAASAEDDTELDHEQDGDDGDLQSELEEHIGDVLAGHGLKPIHTKPLVPDPKPLSPITSETLVPRRPKKSSPVRRASQASQSVEEEEHKRALKQEHYAYHCQICIGEHQVLEACPPGTYVYAPGYRQRLLHAHHAQQKQNMGSLGAGNLLILCEYHHRLWGDHLARKPVLAALTTARPEQRLFPRDEQGKDLEAREGLLAIVELSSEPFRAQLFFTHEHADAWRTSPESTANGPDKACQDET